MSRSSGAATAWVEDAATLGVEYAPSAVEQVLRWLPAAQQRALRSAFGIGERPQELAAIAAEIGISVAQLGRLQHRALRRLRALAVLADATPSPCPGTDRRACNR